MQSNYDVRLIAFVFQSFNTKVALVALVFTLGSQ